VANAGILLGVSLHLYFLTYASKDLKITAAKKMRLSYNLQPALVIAASGSPFNLCFISPDGMNSALEAHYLIRITQPNPEIQAIAANARWTGILAY
jgi:hypothetical protein